MNEKNIWGDFGYMSGGFLNAIEVPEFQRKLSNSRVEGIIAAAKAGTHIPPIFLAFVTGRYFVIDGNHRLEAWRKAPEFLLGFECRPMTLKEALHAFVTANVKSIRVQKSHVFKFADTQYCRFLRSKSKTFGVSEMEAHSLVVGLAGKKYLDHDASLNGVRREAKEILSEYVTSDNFASDRGVYRKSGTLLAIGAVCRESRNKVKAMKAIKKLDFGNQSRLARAYGTGFYQQKRMRDIMRKHVLNTLS